MDFRPLAGKSEDEEEPGFLAGESGVPENALPREPHSVSLWTIPERTFVTI